MHPDDKAVYFATARIMEEDHRRNHPGKYFCFISNTLHVSCCKSQSSVVLDNAVNHYSASVHISDT